MGSAQGSLGPSTRACLEEESSRLGGLWAYLARSGCWVGGRNWGCLTLASSSICPLLSCQQPCNLPQVTCASDALQSPGEWTKRDSPLPPGPRVLVTAYGFFLVLNKRHGQRTAGSPPRGHALQ